MQGKHLAYRPDIDGLRALAVLAVVIFHFNKEWLPGGFVGVDIFFVISGFLITGIITRQINAGRFSFQDFYIRRMRRIIPATLFVTVVSLIFGALFMLPKDLMALAKSAVAATLSVANIYFWRFLDISYFAASSDTVPLLHLWSLGVEEQFYLIWPAALVLGFKFISRKYFMFMVVVLAACSFWIGQKTIVSDPSYSYYMLPSRAGELIIGAMTYWMCQSTEYRARAWTSGLLAVIGSIGLAWSLLFVRETGGFPGFISAVPAVSTALLIASGTFGKSAVTTALSTRPLVAVGLVSFSLYLWHWPVLAFYRYAYGEPNTLSAVVACTLVMILATVFSYFKVEKKFRSGDSVARTLFQVVSVAAIVAFFGVVIINLGGKIANPLMGKDKDLHLATANVKSDLAYSFSCHMKKFNARVIDESRCIVGDNSKKPSMLIIGDSNAAHYLGFIKLVGERKGFSARNITHSACVPFAENAGRYVSKVRVDSCERYGVNTIKYAKGYKVVFISAQWATYSKNDMFYQDFEKQIALLSREVPKVVVGLQVPRFNKYDRQCAEKSQKIPGLNCESRSTFLSSTDTATNKRIREIVSRYPNVTTFSVRDYLCGEGTCSAYLDGVPLYFDSSHLSMYGSYKLGKRYMQYPMKEAEIVF
ncbi:MULTISPECIES: acyltransferase family protein [Pseudomonas]|uniref:acyltransferase family protein n=1 Tax=Pseudomonas TaxID=286 RepID=UPI000A887666|nr:acyltransferase family protein [Pseudomonas sp. NBRC 111132]